MYIFTRPCARKPRWRKRRIPRAFINLLIALGCTALVVGLLFLAPQWLLVVLILLLSVSIVLLYGR